MTYPRSTCYEVDPYETTDLELSAFLSYRGIQPSSILPPQAGDPSQYATFSFPKSDDLAEALIEWTSNGTTLVNVRRYNNARRRLFIEARKAGER